MHKRPWKLFGIYFLLYMSNAIYTSMVPVHLSDQGLTKEIIGLILAAGPLVMILTQPLWGLWGDRANSKNHVFLIMLTGAALAGLLFLLPVRLEYTLPSVMVFIFFQSAAFPMSDAMALEYLHERHNDYPYGRVRMAGTLGFILMSYAAGQVAQIRFDWVFYMLALSLLFTAGMAGSLPRMQGYTQKRGKLALAQLLRDRTLAALLVFFMIYQLTLAYHSSFFAIQVRAVGGEQGVTMVGIAFTLSAAVEIPVLLNIDKIWNRVGTGWLLLVILAVNIARWLVVSHTQDLYVLIATQALHFMGHAVSTFVMARYVATKVPPHLRVSGQMLVFMAGMGIARGVGSLLSGQLAGAVGITQGFFWCAALLGLSFVPLLIWLLNSRRKGITI